MCPLSSEEVSAAATDLDVPTSPLELSWPKTTTPLEALDRALYAMADEVSGVTSEGAEDWDLLIYPRSAGANRDQLAHRLRQEVTDQTLRVRIAERTDPVRNLVFALAFSRSGLAATDGSSSPEVE